MPAPALLVCWQLVAERCSAQAMTVHRHVGTWYLESYQEDSGQ